MLVHLLVKSGLFFQSYISCFLVVLVKQIRNVILFFCLHKQVSASLHNWLRSWMLLFLYRTEMIVLVQSIENTFKERLVVHKLEVTMFNVQLDQLVGSLDLCLDPFSVLDSNNIVLQSCIKNNFDMLNLINWNKWRLFDAIQIVVLLLVPLEVINQLELFSADDLA